jgi:probable rRNA maturation factor
MAAPQAKADGNDIDGARYAPLLPMVVNRQNKMRVDVAGVRALATRLGEVLRLGSRHFDISLVDDEAIRKLNRAFRNRRCATDVLSFPWMATEAGHRRGAPERDRQRSGEQRGEGEFSGFLGDVVISVETAQRNARAAGHSTAVEIRWLMLHGLLHLLGMDHETDQGEMESLELALRDRLELNDPLPRKAMRRKTPANHAATFTRRPKRAWNHRASSGADRT